MNIPIEPTEAFPYTPPTDEMMLKYANIFELSAPLPKRFLKLFFDLMFFIFIYSITCLNKNKYELEKICSKNINQM